GGLEASKSDQPCIYRCHAGLTEFSILMVIAGHLVGLVVCVQVSRRNVEIEFGANVNVDSGVAADYRTTNGFTKYIEIGLMKINDM
ncbi:PocR ligand-binding domain-containing protein, partial [Escherichia coli]|uniref:PocR ligand-binding domain-containing protein n=1 Tax=Escherichia coli TaxID=562 RepID=UPI001484FD6B